MGFLTDDTIVKTNYAFDNETILKENYDAIKKLFPHISEGDAWSAAAARTPGGRRLVERGYYPKVQGNDFVFSKDPMSYSAGSAADTLAEMSNQDVKNLAPQSRRGPCPIVQIKPSKSDCKTNGRPVVITAPRPAYPQQKGGIVSGLWRSIVRSGGMNGMMSAQEVVELANAVEGYGTNGNYNLTRDPRSRNGLVVHPQRWPWHSESYDYRPYFLDNMGNKIYAIEGSDGYYHAIDE